LGNFLDEESSESAREFFTREENSLSKKADSPFAASEILLKRIQANSMKILWSSLLFLFLDKYTRKFNYYFKLVPVFFWRAMVIAFDQQNLIHREIELFLT